MLSDPLLRRGQQESGHARRLPHEQVPMETRQDPRVRPLQVHLHRPHLALHRTTRDAGVDPGQVRATPDIRMAYRVPQHGGRNPVQDLPQLAGNLK